MNVDTGLLVINIILTIISVGLAVNTWNERKRSKSQVKIWMEQANGVSQALRRVIQDKWAGLYSDINGITNAVNSIQASAFSLYQSLYEERVLSEKEYKNHAMKLREHIDKQNGLTTKKPRQKPKAKK